MKRWIAGGVVLVALAVVTGVAWWSTGAMDSALVHLGLNKNECVQNGFGNWFCGDAAQRMKREAAAAKRAAAEAKAEAEARATEVASQKSLLSWCIGNLRDDYPTKTDAELAQVCEEDREWAAAQRRYEKAGYKTYPEGHPCTLPEIYPDAKCCTPDNVSGC